MKNQDDTIQIAGAGLAGLAASIVLASSGRKVIIFEACGEVGNRFQGDHQGLENWTTFDDVLSILRSYGLKTTFNTLACSQGTAFDAWGKSYPISSNEPLFYLIERGPGIGTIDNAFLEQAIELGVDVRFHSKVDSIEGKGIFAKGPKKITDAIAVGFHFDTTMDDGFWIICDDRIAPKGYAYLLVMNNRGTVKSCIFPGTKNAKTYVSKTVDAFKDRVGLTMENIRPHGGTGYFQLPKSACIGHHPVVGEQAGFQDFLWGFGMRPAIVSGVLAAKSIIENVNYDALWKKELQPLIKTSIVNRTIYKLLGNRGYRLVLQYIAHMDARQICCTQYNPSIIKKCLYPLSRLRSGRR